MSQKDMEEWDDRSLIESISTNQAAISILYRRHLPTIEKYVKRRLGSNQDAEDIISETFLAMVREIVNYRWTGAPFESWLYRLASTQIHRWLRRRRWQRLWKSLPDGLVDAREPKQESDAIARLRQALLKLPEKYQTPLALHYLEELPIEAIAEILRARPGTIKSQLSRGRRLLESTLSVINTKEFSHEQQSARSTI